MAKITATPEVAHYSTWKDSEREDALYAEDVSIPTGTIGGVVDVLEMRYEFEIIRKLQAVHHFQNVLAAVSLLAILAFIRRLSFEYTP